MSDPAWTERETGRYRRCDHCGYTLPDDPHRGERGLFCSRHCLEAAEPGTEGEGGDGSGANLEHGAYKRVSTGVEPLDALAPNGVPADALVALAGEAGTRRTELATELVWRALERGEPAVVVAYADPPEAALERFFAADWNVLPALEDDRLRVVDCFTGRLEDREAYLEARNDWGRFVADVADDGVVVADEPDDVHEVVHVLQRTLDDLEMTETGLVAVDSLPAVDSVAGDAARREFLAELRANVCAARYVPVVAGASAADDAHDPDGIVDLRLADHLAPGSRLKQLSVRKLAGASHRTEWLAYEYAPGRGLFSFDSAEAGGVYDIVGPGRPAAGGR